MKTKILILTFYIFFFNTNCFAAEAIYIKCKKYCNLIEVKKILQFCRHKHFYYLKLKIFREKLHTHKFTFETSSEEESRCKLYLRMANTTERELYFDHKGKKIEFSKKLPEIIRDIDNLGDSTILFDLIRLLDK